MSYFVLIALIIILYAVIASKKAVSSILKAVHAIPRSERLCPTNLPPECLSNLPLMASALAQRKDIPRLVECIELMPPYSKNEAYSAAAMLLVVAVEALQVTSTPSIANTAAQLASALTMVLPEGSEDGSDVALSGHVSSAIHVAATALAHHPSGLDEKGLCGSPSPSELSLALTCPRLQAAILEHVMNEALSLNNSAVPSTSTPAVTGANDWPVSQRAKGLINSARRPQSSTTAVTTAESSVAASLLRLACAEKDRGLVVGIGLGMDHKTLSSRNGRSHIRQWLAEHIYVPALRSPVGVGNQGGGDSEQGMSARQRTMLIRHPDALSGVEAALRDMEGNDDSSTAYLSSSPCTLLLGEGDLSFSVALLAVVPVQEGCLTVTTYDSQARLFSKYKKAR